MSATPIVNPRTYRVFVRAHYISDNRPLCNTFYIATTGVDPTDDDFDVFTSRANYWLTNYYIPTASNDVHFDPIEFRRVSNPQDLVWAGGDYLHPIGGAGEPAPRAMALNLAVVPFAVSGRSQRNRIQMFGVPISAIATFLFGGYDSHWVSARLAFMTGILYDEFTPPFDLAVYSPLTGLTYYANSVFAQPIPGVRETRSVIHARG